MTVSTSDATPRSRKARITAAIVVASGIEHHSQEVSIEIGLRRVAEVLFGCFVGLAVS
jgi:hypothetical protein